MIVRFDTLNRFVAPKVTLCNPCSRYNSSTQTIDYSIGVLNNIKNFTMNYNFNAQSTGSFEYTDLTNTVDDENYKLHYKEIYTKLQEYRYLFIQDFGFCIITNVNETQTIVNGKKTLVKQIDFSSCDKELENYEVPIFTTEDIDTVTMTLQEVIEEITSTYSNWSINVIDNDLIEDKNGKTIYRTFQDISAENLYNFMFGTEGSIEDAFDCIIDCDYKERTFTFYSKDNYIQKHSTNIILSDNLLKDLSYDSSSEDLYSALSIEGDNELNIRAVNPNGTNIIYNFDHFKKEGWLPDDLIEKINLLEQNIAKVSEAIIDTAKIPNITYPSLYSQLCTQFEIAQREYYNLVQERDAIRLKTESKELALTNICNDTTLTDEDSKQTAIKQAALEVDKMKFGSLEPFNEIINYIIPVPDEEWLNDWNSGNKYQDEICFVKRKTITSISTSSDNKTLEGLDQLQNLYEVVTPSKISNENSGFKTTANPYDNQSDLYYLDDSKINWNKIYFYYNPVMNVMDYDGSNNPDCFFNATKNNLKLYLTPNPSKDNKPLYLINSLYVPNYFGNSDLTEQGIQYFSNNSSIHELWDVSNTLLDTCNDFRKLNLYKLEYGLNCYGYNPCDNTGEYSELWRSGDVLDIERKTETPSNCLGTWYYNNLIFPYGNNLKETCLIGIKSKSKDLVDDTNPNNRITTYRWYFTDANTKDDYIEIRSPITGEKCSSSLPPCVSINDLYIDERWGFHSECARKFYINYYLTSTSQAVTKKWLNYRQLKKAIENINELCSINIKAKPITNISIDSVTTSKSDKNTEIDKMATDYGWTNDYKENIYKKKFSNYNATLQTYNLNITTSDTPIFTEEDIKRLYSYIKVGTYSNTDLTVTTNMTDKEKVQQAEILLQKGKDKLKDISENLKKISVTPKDFIFNKEFVNYSTQLESGAAIKIKPEKVLANTNDSMLEEYYLSNFSINYDDKTLSMTFGNKLNRFDLKSLFDDVLGDISKSAFQIKKIKQKL